MGGIKKNDPILVLSRGSFKIEDFQELESKFVSVENEEGMPANFIISAGTYIVDNAEIEVGAVITGFFKADAPEIMIYPPQYGVDVVVVEKKANM